ncbi:uncharacterized protein LOC110381388 isoform X1 [Helicoverpa armigera]|uniref:uncharacterized protein LOC110381388 isoform X1 n=2 Tax=Helicoverpa armigera TaxID=29058 RepID=UPI003082EA10
MLKIYVFLCFFGFVLADPDHEGQIHFTVGHYKASGHTYLTCEVEKKEYTVHEGEKYNIVVHYWNDFQKKSNFINDVTCENKNKQRIVLAKEVNKSISTFTAQTGMHDNWNCTVFAHKNINQFLPLVKHPDPIYINDTFAGAYCSMKINVARRESPPQTILVNNMVLPTSFNHRFDVSFLWRAEYRYGDGDLINATCANFQNTAPVTMSYFFADNLSNLFNSSAETKSVAAGFITEMHHEHNGTVMTCSCKGQGHTLIAVMVTFILGNFKYNNQIAVKINGKYLRYYVPDNNSFSELEYKSTRGESITVVCEKKDQNTVLQILEAESLIGHTRKNSSMSSTISFESSKNIDKKFRCGLDSENKGQIVLIELKFSIGELQISTDLHPIDVQLEPKSTVLELYYYRKLRVIYYDFEVGQSLNVVCKKLFEKNVAIMKLNLEYPAENIDKLYPQEERNISHSFELNEKNEATNISCQLREMAGGDESKLIREIKIILREKQITTTSTTTTTSMPVDPPLTYKIVAVVVSVVSIIICVTTAVIKMKKKSQVQGGPHNPNYENLQNPRDPTIPAYPPQWDNQYAVPVDRRSENTTYSVPFTEPAYAEAIPKSQRNKTLTDPTYAVLDIKNQPQKNVYKETDDPNYSEVYATRKEQCYAEVLPKVLRDKFKKDNNPYVNVGNESPYANAGEPMYCEPNVSRDNGTYANVNNERYANSRPNEYVEPTYCEPPKPMARGKKNKR